MTKNTDLLRKLPSVDQVLKNAVDLIERWGHEPVTQSIREEIQLQRDNIRQDLVDTATTSVASIIERVEQRLVLRNKASLKPVFNLTGTVLHTNLGRALLPGVAIEAVTRVASQACNLEFDLDSGLRGDRDSHIDGILADLCGAESATAVNNNAAAVLLALNTFALDREVVVSRGELVEIGGAFRMPEIIQSAGCKLYEVGTTNRTHLKDYAGAIGSNTALLLKVHTSNYRIEGFTSEVKEDELARLAGDNKIPSMVDLGSGNLADFTNLGLPHETTIRQTLESGVDIVTFSGDKLLGGPQCGVIVGKKAIIDKIKSNPMKRALRTDKMTIAALHEVLRLYQDPASISEKLPTLFLLRRNREEIRSQATRLLESVRKAVEPGFNVRIEDCESQVGSGALPVETLPSAALVITNPAGDDRALRELAAAMRQLEKPVIGRLHNGELLLDLRCLEDEEGFAAQVSSLEKLPA